jgi:hypothetical protein
LHDIFGFVVASDDAAREAEQALIVALDDFAKR